MYSSVEPAAMCQPTTYSFQPEASSQASNRSMASVAACSQAGEENEQCALAPEASRHRASGWASSHQVGISSISRGRRKASPGRAPQVARRKSSSTQRKSYAPGAVIKPGRKGRMALEGLMPRSPAYTATEQNRTPGRAEIRVAPLAGLVGHIRVRRENLIVRAQNKRILVALQWSR